MTCSAASLQSAELFVSTGCRPGEARPCCAGDFDALVIGLQAVSRFKGQIVVPYCGFCGRDAHMSLIRENRPIAGVYSRLGLSPRLRQAVLLTGDKEGSGTT